MFKFQYIFLKQIYIYYLIESGNVCHIWYFDQQKEGQTAPLTHLSICFPNNIHANFIDTSKQITRSQRSSCLLHCRQDSSIFQTFHSLSVCITLAYFFFDIVFMTHTFAEEHFIDRIKFFVNISG